MRKMFSLTGILSKDARMSPVVVSGSIRGSLATFFPLAFSWFSWRCRAHSAGAFPHCDQRQEEREIAVDRLDDILPRRRLRAQRVVLQADVDQTGHEQARRLPRVRRRNQTGERKATEEIDHETLFACVEVVGKLRAQA